ncbi:DUF5659 domain-containing protein [Fictibacillus nanhaiensis]|uniref:DUF5659 domain-containing protein n=1 Tax=Fictibacillus nanhaiensis TaxID=742169 RepID=UPI002E233FFB|nr:DUF5659 domain-containing protein [Fictibacillus nanhaiensis]
MKDMYYTQSLNLAAYIMSKGIDPVGKTKSGKSVTIYFNKTNELHDVVRDYNNQEELKKFISAFRELKHYLNKVN